MNLLESTRAVFASGLPAQEKLVAFAILNHWSKAGETFPGVPRLMDWTSLSRCSVMRSIKRLEACGAIVVAREVGRANRYDLQGLTSLPQRPVSHSDQSPTATPPVSTGDGSSLPQRLDPSLGETRSDPLSDPLSDPGKRSKPRRSAPASKSDAKLKGPKKAKPETRWPTAHPELTKRYFELFEQHRNTKPFFRAREGKAIADLLDATQGDVVQAATLIDNGLSNWSQATILTIASDPSKAQTRRVVATGGGTRAGDLLSLQMQRVAKLEAVESKPLMWDVEKGRLLP